MLYVVCCFCFCFMLLTLFFVFVFVFVFCFLFFVTKFKVKAFFCFLIFENKNTTNNIQRLAAYTRHRPLTITSIYTFFKVTWFFKNRAVLLKQLDLGQFYHVKFSLL